MTHPVPTAQARRRAAACCVLVAGAWTASSAPAAGQGVLAPAALAWAALGVDARLTVGSFPVMGRDLRSAVRHLQTSGPLADDGRRRHALTTYVLTTRWRPVPEAEACRVGEAHVSADVEILLPSWPGSVDAPLADHERWSTLVADLAAHEEGHRDATLLAALRLIREVRELEAPTCPDLADRVGARAALVEFDLEGDHRALDAPRVTEIKRGRFPPR